MDINIFKKEEDRHVKEAITAVNVIKIFVLRDRAISIDNIGNIVHKVLKMENYGDNFVKITNMKVIFLKKIETMTSWEIKILENMTSVQKNFLM